MSVIILIIILGILIFVHELGHFLIAKKSGIRVDEFAIGFPPRLWSFTKNGTKYALNLIPFGGYVKIFGETPDEESLNSNSTDSFINKSKLTQAAVLFGGVLFNIIFAWILISITLMAGFPTIVSESNRDKIVESHVVITKVYEDSPAAIAEILPGDKILKLSNSESELNFEQISVESFQQFISSSKSDITLNILRADGEKQITVTPQQGIISDKQAIGVSMERIGILKYPFFAAIFEGFIMTGQMIRDIAVGLFMLIGSAVSGEASLDNVAGPVGIVTIIDNAANFGFYYLVSFTAFISINLAVLNVLPLPALDGGRLLVVLIESISRKQLNHNVVNAVNAFGFLALIILMIIITINDVVKLF